VPVSGHYKEVLNTDACVYGGGDVSNDSQLQPENIGWMNHHHSLVISIPPLAGIVITLA
jgi:1,4-alpha-glucan branching enzyme